ncbi:MAG: hypothetical protein KME46_11190 [Brasilonema angustatum HA4187-MV1]|jgi:hypothetical protein|nr:hypothetical protein [Brasilonema angustatum HA4187-MV1]
MTNTKPYKILFFKLHSENRNDCVRQKEEFLEISQAILGSEHFEILNKKQETYTLEQVAEVIDEHNPNIIHFSGHGSQNYVEIPKYSLIYGGKTLGADPLYKDDLINIFGKTKKDTKPRILFFNVCLAGGIIDNNEGKAFDEYFDCIIAMKHLLDERLAVTIASKFYTKIKQGVTVEEAINSLNPIIAAAVKDANLGNSLSYNKNGLNPQPQVNGNNQIKFDLNIGTSYGTIKLIGHIPGSANEKIAGREQALETLHQQMQQHQKIAITGIDGIGKTELAKQYGFKYWEQVYPGGVYWFQGQDISSVLEQIRKYVNERIRIDSDNNFYNELYEDIKNLEKRKEKNEYDTLEKKQELIKQQKKLANDWFWLLKSEKPMLVIFDEVTDYKKFKDDYKEAVGLNYKILITTQYTPDDIELFKLYPLDESTALEFLKKCSKKEIDQELSDVKAICQKLGYLPFALKLVGKYVNKRSISFQKMKERLEKEGIKNEGLENIECVLDLSWKELSYKSQNLAFVLSLLPPICNISDFDSYWEFLKDRLDLLRSSLGENAVPVLRCIKNFDDFEKARVNLEEWNLLTVQNQGICSLNSLVRQFFVKKLMDSPDSKKIKDVLGLSDPDLKCAVFPTDFSIVSTGNDLS